MSSSEVVNEQLQTRLSAGELDMARSFLASQTDFENVVSYSRRHRDVIEEWSGLYDSGNTHTHFKYVHREPRGILAHLGIRRQEKHIQLIHIVDSHDELGSATAVFELAQIGEADPVLSAEYMGDWIDANSVGA